MKNNFRLVIFICVTLAVLAGGIIFFFVFYKTNHTAVPLTNQNTQASNFTPVPATYFLVSDGTKKVQGDFLITPDHRFVFAVVRLVRIWIDNDNVFASIAVEPSGKPQTILVYDHVANLVFYLQVQHTLDFSPISKDYTADILKNAVSTKNDLQKHAGELAIITLQTLPLDNPPSGREKTFSFLNSQVNCNKTLFSAISQKSNNTVSCIPYVSKIAVYGK